jgi:hypothetical protein
VFNSKYELVNTSASSLRQKTISSILPLKLTWASVLQLEVLVSELLSVDALATGAVVLGEVTALAHEIRDDAVEGGALVAKALLTSAQSTEVF